MESVARFIFSSIIHSQDRLSIGYFDILSTTSIELLQMTSYLRSVYLITSPRRRKKARGPGYEIEEKQINTGFLRRIISFHCFVPNGEINFLS